MSNFRIVHKAVTKKYRVEERETRGSYDGYYSYWCASKQKVNVKRRFLFWEYDETRRVPVEYDTVNEAKDYIIRRLENKEKITDKIVFEV